MKIALVQSDCVWENPEATLRALDALLVPMEQELDLIVLPEMFATGFTMRAAIFAEEMSGKTVAWMQNLARTKNAAVCGSVIIKENDLFFNRFLFVLPNGEKEAYDKRHLFTLAGEDRVFAKGNERIIINYKGFVFCPIVCYDLRFPVFARNSAPFYDVLLCIANWPEARIAAWNTLLRARAIENMCYVVGVNRVGKDTKNAYSGNSQLIDSLGTYVEEPTQGLGVFVATISKENLEENRLKYGFLQDGDSFELLGL